MGQALFARPQLGQGVLVRVGVGDAVFVGVCVGVLVAVRVGVAVARGCHVRMADAQPTFSCISSLMLWLPALSVRVTLSHCRQSPHQFSNSAFTSPGSKGDSRLICHVLPPLDVLASAYEIRDTIRFSVRQHEPAVLCVDE
jgi:hypothetical protein